MKCIVMLSAMAVGVCSAYEPTPEELTSINAGLDAWLAKSEGAASMPPREAIAELGRGIRKLARGSIFPVERRKEVFREVQRELLLIPGHADYFAEKIRKDDELRAAGRWHEVKGGVVWDFETLEQLPSPETVRVLGSFLDDEKGRIPEEDLLGADMIPTVANSLLAARAFAVLGIVNPPLHEKPGSMNYDDIQPWRLWFAQVEAGTRTFRFEGDPREYSLAGPVSEASPAPTSDAVRRPPSPPAASLAGGPASEKPPRFPWEATSAAGLLLVLALWFAFKRKSAASNGRPRNARSD